MTLVNICGEAQGYDLQFFSESGAPQSLSLLVPHDDENPEGKDVFKEVTGLKTNGERKPLEPGQSIYFWFGDTGADLRRAYGVFADDGGGCITGWSLYVYRRYAEEGMQTSSISFQEVSPRWAMEARVEAEYGCTTAYAISGDGSPVTMEINNWDGSVVGTIDLGPVYFHAFALIDHFPEGLISGICPDQRGGDDRRCLHVLPARQDVGVDRHLPGALTEKENLLNRNLLPLAVIVVLLATTLLALTRGHQQEEINK